MDIPLLGFLAEVTLFAFPLCWLIRVLEKWIVGVKSDFWDAFGVSFFFLISITVSGYLLIVILQGSPWILYDVLNSILGMVCLGTLLRVVLKHKLRHSVQITVITMPILFAAGYGLSYFGLYY